jgi:hypothetical protein
MPRLRLVSVMPGLAAAPSVDVLSPPRVQPVMSSAAIPATATAAVARDVRVKFIIELCLSISFL